MNKLFKECLIALALIVAVPKAILFVAQTIQIDTDKIFSQKDYEDFIVSYCNNHPDDANRGDSADRAWRISRSHVKSCEQYNNAVTSNYFIQLIIGQAAFLTLIYLGCTLGSPVIASACIVSSGITYVMFLDGMGGIALWYGMMIELISACIALFFILRFLRRNS
jgi:hypothetical protein